MNKLKSCPFCGTQPFIIQRKNKVWDIGCIESMSCICWICSDKKCKLCTDGYVHKFDAINNWTKRRVK